MAKNTHYPPPPTQKKGQRKRNVCMLSKFIHFCHTFLKQSVISPTLCFNSLLVRVDFPTFGSPMIATFRVLAFSGWFGFSINFWSCSPLDNNNNIHTQHDNFDTIPYSNIYLNQWYWVLYTLIRTDYEGYGKLMVTRDKEMSRRKAENHS